MWVNILGYGGTLVLSFVLTPQVVKSFKEKTANGVSWGFIGLQFTAAVIFVMYGILLKAYPIIVANVLVGSQTACVAYIKMKHGAATTVKHIDVPLLNDEESCADYGSVPDE